MANREGHLRLEEHLRDQSDQFFLINARASLETAPPMRRKILLPSHWSGGSPARRFDL